MATVLQELAQQFDRYIRCSADNYTGPGGNARNAKDQIQALCNAHLPDGSGVDANTLLDFEASKPDKLIFRLDFHHMDEHGYYDGWNSYSAVVKPSLAFGFDVVVHGCRGNSRKYDTAEHREYLAELLDHALSQEVDANA